MEMYSTNNEGKSVVAERFIRTFKTKIFKYMLKWNLLMLKIIHILALEKKLMIKILNFSMLAI